MFNRKSLIEGSVHFICSEPHIVPIAIGDDEMQLKAVPTILDVTAGYRGMWNGKYQNVLFLDRRKKVKPDVVASNEFLPFTEQCFDKIVYDPPHLIRHSQIKPNSLMAGYEDKFTLWKKKTDYYHNIVKVQEEAYRVLKEDGVLFFKHIESPDNLITINIATSLMRNWIVSRTTRKTSQGWGKGQTVFVTLKKRTVK